MFCIIFDQGVYISFFPLAPTLILPPPPIVLISIYASAPPPPSHQTTTRVVVGWEGGNKWRWGVGRTGHADPHLGSIEEEQGAVSTTPHNPPPLPTIFYRQSPHLFPYGNKWREGSDRLEGGEGTPPLFLICPPPSLNIF
uniref:Uncharacterized protein n=1 Tax=Morchella brunnea TaxID=1174671 RepID=A0A8K1MHC9_9PEZI|nr:hypothetical protein LK370_mgp110 [Morchella brunnea]UBU98550.1 hypothetical protein [Morchella brunnea]